MDWAVRAAEARRHYFVRKAAQHNTLFGYGPVRGMDFRTLLETLAHIRQVRPVILRVRFLHLHSECAAHHTGRQLCCPHIQGGGDG